ncbi:MAG: hypothetical protein KAU50_03570 [Candidatus Marinimicrobia bacterium]|nr:hypothetical protein [Candidatus Neomarinimicrobiota bacterium]
MIRIFSNMACYGLLLVLTGCMPWTSGKGELSADQLRHLVATSDLIVEGTLENIQADSGASQQVYTGHIHVSEVLWGDMISYMLGEVVEPEKVAVVLAASQIEKYKHRVGIWLLIEGDDDLYLADTSRFISTDYGLEINRHLRRDLILVRPDPTAPATNLAFELLFRNAHPKDALVPAFRWEKGTLFLHADVKLTVTRSGDKAGRKDSRLQPMDGAMEALDDLEQLVVQTGEEYVVPINLPALFDYDSGWTHTVEFSIKGYGKSRLVIPPFSQ